MIPYGRSLSSNGTRSIGGDVTPAAKERAARTSIGKTSPSRSSVENVARRTISPPVSTVRGSTHRGSLAGLKSSHSVHLQHNNSGYFNPKIQKARYSSPKRMPNSPVSSIMETGTQKKISRTLDKRILGSEMGSISKLYKIIK